MRPPLHTAEEAAAWLRKEITHAQNLAKDSEARRQRVNARFSEEMDALTDDAARATLRDRWGRQNERMRGETARWEASASDYTRMLQWLTGEVW